MTLIEFMAEQMKITQDRFLKILSEIPDELFHRQPNFGGHAPAWHALHLAEWNKICLSPKFAGVSETEKFGHLGWESSEFAINTKGETAIKELDSKESIVAFVRQEFERSQSEMSNVTAAQLETKIYTPMGERQVLGLITTQLRHIPYHLGQLNLILKQLKAG